MPEHDENEAVGSAPPPPPGEPSDELWAKHAELCRWLQEAGSVAVAYSGGTDSAFLLKVAHDVLGDRCVAVTGVSASLARGELDGAVAIAEEIGAEHVIIESHELEDPRYVENSSTRCFYCKNDLFTRIQEFAAGRGIAVVVDGSNYDDTGDHRPGLQAARERGVRSPLIDLRITKSELRALSRCLGLPTWDKPAAPCLSSRIPYGTRVSAALLGTIEQAEALLRDLGVRELRVRHHGETARIEVPPADFGRLLQHREQIVRGLKKLGYHYVTIDLEGFRSGRLNEELPKP